LAWLGIGIVVAWLLGLAGGVFGASRYRTKSEQKRQQQQKQKEQQRLGKAAQAAHP
jgi:hypothetical protein